MFAGERCITIFLPRDAILNAYLQQTFQDRSLDRIAQLRLLPDTRSRLVYIFTVLVEGVRRQQGIFEAFMVYRMKQVTSFREPAEQEQTGLSLLIHEIIKLGQDSHELRSDLDEGMLAGLFEYVLIAAIKPLYLQPARYDRVYIHPAQRGPVPERGRTINHCSIIGEMKYVQPEKQDCYFRHS